MEKKATVHSAPPPALVVSKYELVTEAIEFMHRQASMRETEYAVLERSTNTQRKRLALLAARTDSTGRAEHAETVKRCDELAAQCNEAANDLAAAMRCTAALRSVMQVAKRDTWLPADPDVIEGLRRYYARTDEQYREGVQPNGAFPRAAQGLHLRRKAVLDALRPLIVEASKKK